MNEIKISELKTNETISNLIPEMTEKEYLDLKTNIEHEGIHHAIDINADNTILDGRHRVRACKSLGIESIKYNRHDLSESEAIKFVVDTAVQRRSLSSTQKLDIVLNSEDVIKELVTRARDNKAEAIKKANESNPKHKIDGLASGDAQRLKTKKTDVNVELGKLAGVSKATVTRTKKIRKENPEGYKKILNGESSVYEEYNKIKSKKEPSEPKTKKYEVDNESVTAPPKPKRDIREEMIEREASLSDEDRKKAHEGMTTENFKSYLENIRYTLQQMKDLGMNEEIKNSKEKLTKLLGEF